MRAAGVQESAAVADTPCTGGAKIAVSVDGKPPFHVKFFL
jgi:hypothetical protein